MEIEVDLHGMSLNQAKKHLERELRNAPKDTTVMRVIHGHSHGDAIKRMVEDPNGIRSTRLARRKYTKNPGETLYILQND